MEGLRCALSRSLATVRLEEALLEKPIMKIVYGNVRHED